MAPTTAFDALEARLWPIRLLRVSAASIIALTLALAGHTLGGGETSSPVVILIVLGVVSAAAWLLSTRRLTTGQIVGLLLIAQIAVHLGCLVGTTTSSLSAAMVAGHLVATAVTAVVLSRGESFLWIMAERLGLRVIPLLTAVTLPVCNPGRATTSYDEPRPPTFVFAGGIGLRGPPIGAF